jgi:hypothetical protein
MGILGVVMNRDEPIDRFSGVIRMFSNRMDQKRVDRPVGNMKHTVLPRENTGCA